jgi:chlorophyll synthase
MVPVIELRPAPAVRTRVARTPEVGRRLRDLLVMSRPQFWLLSVVAMQLGFVLATHRILPRGGEILTMANAALVAGPLLWLAVLAVNDARDLDSDRINPRKAHSPLVQGRVTAPEAVRIGIGAGLLAVLAALPLGGQFALGTALVVLLGWAYSTPPLRLKARAGADVLVNAGAVGVLGPLGGWVATTGTTDRFPWPIALVGLMALAALYLPTTLVDLDADRAVGVRTTAVALGRRATFELGFALWTGSAVLAFGLAVAGVVLDPSLVPLHLLMMPLLLGLYRRLLAGRPSFPAVLVVAGAYIVPCAAFVLTYVESI